MNKYCCHCMAQLNETDEKCPMCGKENNGNVPAHHLLPGTILNGRFYVGEALGEGGFGITYIGRDIKLDMKVAIKEFYPNGYVNRSNSVSPCVNDSVTHERRDFFEKGRERFLKEAQILAKFSGEPGIVDVRDFFEENNTAYIIMEYLDGVTLKEYLKKNGVLTPERTIQILMPIMNSLKKVHANGLIHRDISPDNIMIIGNKVKLLDFGAARTVSAAANKSLSIMLKPGYAPEEQYRSKGNQGPWSDIYALCATMYRCITGITPDDATQRVFSDEVKAPSALNIKINPDIEKAIMKGMSVNQSDRYQCIEDLIRGFQGIEVSISDNEQTVAARKNISDDDKETVYLANDIDDKTMLGDDVKTSLPIEERKIIEKGEDNPNNSDSTANKKGKTRNKKSKAPIVIVATVAIIAMFVVLLLPKGNGVNEPIDDGSTVSTQVADENTEEDTFNDFSFTLEGDVYELPCDYEDFTKNGWSISSKENNGESKVSGNSYKSFYISKDKCEITIYAYNNSGDARDIKDCKIGGIKCDSSDEVDLTIAKNITLKSSSEDIKTTFGVPGYSNSTISYDSLIYYAQKDDNNNLNSVKFYISKNGTYSTIEMNNFIGTEDDKTVTNTKKPVYLDDYKAPTSMGNDLKSAVVKIEGDLYQLPAPVSEFIDKGWKIVKQPEYVVSGDTEYLNMEKNGKKLEMKIVNYAEYQTTVENCAVYEINSYGTDTASVLVGSEAKPITIGTAKSIVNETVSDDFKYDEEHKGGASIQKYNFYEYNEREFSIFIKIELGEVSSVIISCKTWEY